MIESPAPASPACMAASTSLTEPPITIRYLPEQIVRAISSSTDGRLEHVVFDLVADADAGKFDRADGFGGGHVSGQGSRVLDEGPMTKLE